MDSASLQGLTIDSKGLRYPRMASVPVATPQTGRLRGSSVAKTRTGRLRLEYRRGWRDAGIARRRDGEKGHSESIELMLYF